MKNIRQIIIDQRKKLNISQSELAEKLGISKGFMSKLENGQTAMSLKRLAQIGETLDIEIFDYHNEENDLFKKWKPVINLFENKNISPEDVLLMIEFINKIKN